MSSSTCRVCGIVIPLLTGILSLDEPSYLQAQLVKHKEQIPVLREKIAAQELKTRKAHELMLEAEVVAKEAESNFRRHTKGSSKSTSYLLSKSGTPLTL